MKKGLIITLPRHDLAMEYLYQYSRPIENVAQEKNVAVKKLEGKDANREKSGSFLCNPTFILVVFNGHGSPTSIGGHDNEHLIDTENVNLLQGKITYARVCEAAAILGKKVREGCFIGYNLPFMFYSDERWSAVPLKDEVARIFFEPSNTVPISLLKGNTAYEADLKSKKQILKSINRILQKKEKESFLFAEALWNNYIGQVVHGNKNAVL